MDGPLQIVSRIIMIETGPKVLPTPPLQYPLSGKQMKIRMKPIQSKPIRSKVSLTFSPTVRPNLVGLVVLSWNYFTLHSFTRHEP